MASLRGSAPSSASTSNTATQRSQGEGGVGRQIAALGSEVVCTQGMSGEATRGPRRDRRAPKGAGGEEGAGDDGENPGQQLQVASKKRGRPRRRHTLQHSLTPTACKGKHCSLAGRESASKHTTQRTARGQAAGTPNRPTKPSRADAPAHRNPTAVRCATSCQLPLCPLRSPPRQCAPTRP